METAKHIIDTACSYIGTYDKGNNNVIFNTHYYGQAVSGPAYPWCCAFVWDIFRMCGASDLFYDGKKTAYCPTVFSWGKTSSLTVNNSNGQLGDIILFDWNNDGVADHIGLIISKNSDGSYTTVEGNTSSFNYSNGGYVLKMTRCHSQILTIIRPRYDKETATPPLKPSVPNIVYQVYTEKCGWLPTVTNLEDYAGIDGQAVKGIRIYIENRALNISAHHLSDGSIDKLTVDGGKYTVKYRVRPIGYKDYLNWMENKKDTGGSSDIYAGIAGKAIDRIQMFIQE